MFDVGFWEVSLIAIVALLVVGPDRLPGMTRTAGHLIGRGKRVLRELKYDLEREAEFAEIDRIKKDFKDKRPLEDLSRDLSESIDIEDKVSTPPKTES